MTYWVSQSDGWHVVTTVDTVIAQDGDAGKDLARLVAKAGCLSIARNSSVT